MTSALWDEQWQDDRFYGTIEAILKNQSWRIADGKVQTNWTSIELATPWMHVRQTGNEHQCTMWQRIYYQGFGIIPQFCANTCYKVVAYPRTCKELFELYEVMKGLDFPSKCGIETRDYIPDKKTPYAAYFYCIGEDQGLERYDKVRMAVPGEIDVLLKQGCTEMELSEEAKVDPEKEARLEDVFLHNLDGKQIVPPWFRNWTKIRWRKYARSIGDQTYKECGPPLLEDKNVYRHFHDKKRQAA